MTIAALIYPCLSVFALQAPAADPAHTVIAPAPIVEEAPQTARPVSVERIILAQADTETVPAQEELTVEAMPEAEFVAPPAGPVPVFADLTDEQVFDKALAYIQGIDTMQAEFTQVAPSGNVSTGTMQMSRPGRLRFEYDAPTPTLIVAVQGLVYIHDTELETTDSYPVNKTPLKFLLAEKIDRSDANLTAVTRSEKSVALTLESIDEETEGQLVLEFLAPEMQLVRWAVYDARGGATIVELDDVKTGVRIANNAFRVPEAGGTFLRDR